MDLLNLLSDLHRVDLFVTEDGGDVLQGVALAISSRTPGSKMSLLTFGLWEGEVDTDHEHDQATSLSDAVECPLYDLQSSVDEIEAPFQCLQSHEVRVLT